MLQTIQAVQALDNHILYLEFANGEKRLYDMKPFLDSPVYAPLRNDALFRKAHIVYDYTVGWTEDIDICPDCAYRDSVPYHT